MSGRTDRFAWGFALGVGLVGLGVVPASGQGHGGHAGFASSHHEALPMHGLEWGRPDDVRWGGGRWGGGGYGYGNGFGFGFGSPFVVGVGGFFPPPMYFPVPVVVPVPMAAGAMGGGLMLPAPAGAPGGIGAMPSPRPRLDPAKSAGFLNLGDNLFRAGNTHRAEQRYIQAARANPNSATPHVRLAQLAVVRGDYPDAADEFRAAMTAEPGWLVNATDVQSLFAEPGDFAKAVAKLESHLQASPGDRDGWLVLGAEWYLSGRARQAADVFTRLNDRKPDATLASFLDATTPDALPRDAP